MEEGGGWGWGGWEPVRKRGGKSMEGWKREGGKQDSIVHTVP